MKDRKKPEGTKARVQASKKRVQHIGTAITLTIFIAIVAISSFLIYSYLNPSPNQTINPDQTNNQPSQLKAAIVDHLSLTAPNQTFKETATNTLKQAGYTVDYYLGEKATIEFYRNLPTHDYGMIILRVHSGLYLGAQPPLGIFTSEPYSKTRYIYEQLTDKVVSVYYSWEGPRYFGITPAFVKSSMNGRFENTVIVMMGCNGLTYTEMAEAFIEKGAKVYISWNKPVSASHTDQATSHLLQHFLIEKQTLKEAVRETFKEVGQDPEYESLLVYYPLEAGDQTIEGTTGTPATKP